MTARNAICRTSMSLLSNPVPRTDRKKSSNECSPTDSHIYDPGADDGIVLAQSGHREGVGCNFRARRVEKLANVRSGHREGVGCNFRARLVEKLANVRFGSRLCEN